MTSSSDETFALIEQIQKHPYIYNFTLPEYAKKDLVEFAWNDVAENMYLSVSECKDKWRNIRTCLLRDLKAMKSKKPKRPYYLRESLQFLVPFVKTFHKTIPKYDDDEFEEDTKDGIINPSTSKRRRNRTQLEYGDNENSDDQDPKRPYVEYYGLKRQGNIKSPMQHFMLSLLPEFESMTEQQIRHFKIEVMLLIDKIKSGQESSDEDDPLQATSSTSITDTCVKEPKDEDSS